jgi:hypothetical protein
MVWKILRRIFKEHLALHLIVPLVVGLLVDVLAAHWLSGQDWIPALTALWSFETIGLIVGVVGAYILIMFHLIRTETSVKFGAQDLAILNGTLGTAASYFATSTIGMKEWFSPISQVFLANIVGQRLRRAQFQDARVLLMCRPGEFDDLEAPYLDGYYAQHLAELHLHYQTPLAFLRRAEILAILRELSSQDRKGLGCFPRWLRWLPWVLLDRLGTSAIRRNLPELDFALVHSMTGEKSILRVSKKGQNVRIRSITGEAIQPYEKLVELISRRVSARNATGEPQLDDAHNFVKLFYPFNP